MPAPFNLVFDGRALVTCPRNVDAQIRRALLAGLHQHEIDKTSYWIPGCKSGTLKHVY